MYTRDMNIYIKIIILTSSCASVLCYDLYLGSDFGARMSYREVKKQGLLFFKRSESLTFEYPEGTNITGIACVDLSPNKMGSVTVEEGGIGFNSVSLYLESERSASLRYTVEIYIPSFLKHTSDQNRIGVVFRYKI